MSHSFLSGSFLSGRRDLKISRKGRLVLAAASALLIKTGISSGAATWTGPAGTASSPTNGNWNSASNWTPGSVPVSSSTTALDFLGSSSTYVLTDDISGVFQLNSLTLGAGNATIAAGAGNSLSFAGSAPVIQQISSGTVNLSAPISLAANTAVQQVSGGVINFSGAIGGLSALTLSNSSGSGNSNVSFTGANTFNGLTVNANVAAIAGLSSGTTQLGSGTVTLSGGRLLLHGQQSGAGSAVQESLGVSGFNADTIVDSAAGTNPSPSSVGTPLSAIDSVGAGNLLFQSGYQGKTTGVPASGVITSALTNVAGGHTVFNLGYNGTSNDLADFNTLRFTGTGTGQTLTFANPVQAKTLDFLACAQASGATFNVTLNFANNTSDTYTSAVSSGPWAFGNPSNIAFTNTQNIHYAGSINSWSFYLTESDITLSAADQNQTIDSVTFTPTSLGSGGSTSEIYAISGQVFGSPQTLSSQSYANNVSVTANSSIDVSGSLSATMGNLTIGSNKLGVTSADGSGNAYSLTLGTVSLTGNATFDVAASTGGGAGSLNLGALNDNGTARTITFNPTGSGSINLGSAAASLVAGTVVNVQGGTLNSNNATALGTTASVDLSSSAILNIGVSQQVSGLNGTSGTVNLNGNTLSVGSSDNLNSNYAGAISGSGTIVTAGTGTVILGGASTYSGTAVNSNGQHIQTSLLVNNGVAVINGPSVGSNGTVTSGPAGTANIMVNPASLSSAEIAIGNTAGLSVSNNITVASGNNGTSTIAGFNTSGITTYAGGVTLGTGSSGDYGHNLTIAGAGSGEVDFTGNIAANGGSTHSAVTINNLSGSGNTTVKFTGVNTYAGGTIVNPGATLVAGLTTSATPLGTNTVNLEGGNLSLQGQLPVGSQQAVGVTGFNADTIVDNAVTGAAPNYARQSSTGTPTSTIDGSNLFYEDGYQGISSNGLPTSGSVTSATTGHVFQLGSYTDFNTLRFTAPDLTTGQTLALATPTQFQTLDFLSTGQGADSFKVVLHFSDSSSDTLGSFSTMDWYGGNAATNAVTGLNPVAQGSGVVANFGGALTIQENDLTLSAADQGKLVTSIQFLPTAVGGASSDIYAISGATAAGNTPLGTQTFANNINVTQNADIDVSGSLNAIVGTLDIGGDTLSITSADTSGNPYSLTMGYTSFNGTSATFNIAKSAGGGVGTLVLGTLDDGGAVQAISKTGAGVLTLSADATSLVNGTIVNVEAGTLNSNSGAALGTLAAVSVANGATFAIGASQQIGSLADYGSPVVNGATVALNGNTLTIGTITDLSSTYSGKIVDGSAAGSITKSGIGTLTLAGASSYSGTTNVQLGTLLAMNGGGSATGSSAVTVANDTQAFLGGTGAIAGPVTVTGNGTIFTGMFPDTSTSGKTAATLKIGTGSNLSGNTLLDVTGVNTSDEIVVGGGSGAVNFGGILTVADPNSTAYGLGQQYDLFSFGSETGTFGTLNLPGLPSNLAWDTSHLYTPGQGYIDVVTAGPASLIWDNEFSATGDGVTWDNGVGGTSQNWNSNGAAASFTSDAAVTFNDSNNNNYLVNLASNVLPSSITVNSAQTYTILSVGGFVIDDYDPSNPTTLTQSGGGTLVVENVNTFTGATSISGTGTFFHLTDTGQIASASFSVGAGASAQIDGLLTGTPAVTANGNIKFAAADGNNDPTAGTLQQNFSSLTIGAGAKVSFAAAASQSTQTVVTVTSLADAGTLDLSNNRLYIDYGTPANDPISSIAALLKSGYNHGGWNGAGIDSSSAATNSSRYGLGYADAADPGNPANLSSGTIEVMYTLLGDANLSGVVDGVDFGIVAANFNKGVTGWDKGDFNYDGVVDGTDFGDLAANFNKGLSIANAGVSASEWAALDAFAAANGLLADVPEPASTGLITLGTIGVLARRRRKANRR